MSTFVFQFYQYFLWQKGCNSPKDPNKCALSSLPRYSWEVFKCYSSGPRVSCRTIMSRSKTITDLCSVRVTDTWNIGVKKISATVFSKSKMAAATILKILWYHQNNEWYIISHVFWSTKHNASVIFQIWVQINPWEPSKWLYFSPK